MIFENKEKPMALISKKFRIGESSTHDYEDVSVFPWTFNFKEISMVEMAGIEPASENFQSKSLHA